MRESDGDGDSLESKARTGGFMRENIMSDHGLFFFLRGPTKSGEWARFLRRLSGMHRAMDG